MPVISHCLGSIQNLTAADTDNQIAAFLFHHPDQTVDFRLAAFSVKIIKYRTASRFLKACLHTAADSFVA